MLNRPLGRGGMSEAWLAKDLETGSEVVLKMAPASGDGIEPTLLQREFDLLRRLEHPNIVRGLDFVRDGDISVLALEHLSGGDARQLRESPLSGILDELVPLADALAHAHERGVIHRDIKAANLLLDSRGRAHLADFGIGDLHGPGSIVVGGGSPTSSSPSNSPGCRLSRPTTSTPSVL